MWQIRVSDLYGDDYPKTLATVKRLVSLTLLGDSFIHSRWDISLLFNNSIRECIHYGS